MKSSEFITEETLTEAPMHRVVDDIVDAINDKIGKEVYAKMTGKRKTMMGLKGEKVNLALVQVKAPSSRVWTRGDGSRYKEPGYLYVSDYFTTLQRKYSTIKTMFPTKEALMDHVWEVLKSSKSAKDMGSVSGEFGSDEYMPAMKAGGLLWVRRGPGMIEYGAVSRLNNTSIWRWNKPEGFKEPVRKGTLVKVISDTQAKAQGYKKPIEIGSRVQINSTYQEMKIRAFNPAKQKVKLENNRLYDPKELKFLEPWGYNLR